jgi:hypothetical protein
VELDTKGGKTVEGLSNPTNLSALYISNYKNGLGTPVAEQLQVNLSENFADNGKGLLTFSYTLGDGICSPAYVFITIWLDVNGDGVNDDDKILTQDVKIVIYPAIYIVGDKSENFSVFVNGNYNKDRSTDIKSNTKCTII